MGINKTKLRLRMQALEMRSYRSILFIFCVDRNRNGVARDAIKQETAPLEDCITTVKKSKVKCYGHLPRSTKIFQHICSMRRQMEMSDATERTSLRCVAETQEESWSVSQPHTDTTTHTWSQARCCLMITVMMMMMNLLGLDH